MQGVGWGDRWKPESGYRVGMDREAQLRAAADAAKAAIERGDNAAADSAWQRYELITAAGLPPNELLRQTVELSRSVASIKVHSRS